MSRFLPIFAAVTLSVALFSSGIVLGFYAGQQDGIEAGKRLARWENSQPVVEEIMVWNPNQVNEYLAAGWRVKSAYPRTDSAPFVILMRPK